jgi:hypothetical protein
MKKIITNKRTGFLYLGIILVSVTSLEFFMQSCNKDFESDDAQNDTKFTLFEKEFANALSPDKKTVKFIGFKTYNISENERDDFKKIVSEFGEEMKNKIVADDYSFFRVYFPLHTAIVQYGGKIYTADEKGLVNIPNLQDVNDVVIIGRKKSETVCGTGSNIIKKDWIRLKGSFKIKTYNGIRLGYSIENNVCVFNLTDLANCCTKTLSCDVPRLKNESEDAGEGVSCYQNHGQKTCSDAFNIHGGRCSYVPKVCMDYNGRLGNCNNGSIIAFIGSDCDYAMGAGHCWNEIMK